MAAILSLYHKLIVNFECFFSRQNHRPLCVSSFEYMARFKHEFLLSLIFDFVFDPGRHVVIRWPRVLLAGTIFKDQLFHSVERPVSSEDLSSKCKAIVVVPW